MAYKRDTYRNIKRFPVKFGVGVANTSGFTEDFSHFGLFVKAGRVQSPGRELIVELSLPQERLVSMVAAKKVPLSLLRTYKGEMGLTIVRFLDGEEDYRALCDELHRLRMERNCISSKNLSREEGVMREEV